MSRWNNFGVSITNENAKEDIEDSLKSIGLKVWASGDDYAKATDFNQDERIEVNKVKSALNSHKDSVSGFIAVDANDTSDTASGRVYELDGGSWEIGRSDHSGGENSRYDWIGLSYDGVRLKGGKY